MPTVTSITLNIFGNVTFNDGTTSPIEVTLAHNNSISTPHSTNLVNFATLKRDRALILADFFGALGVFTLTPDTTPSTNIATDVVLSMSGTVTYDNRTSETFSVEYFNSVVSFTESIRGVWSDAVNFNESLVISVLEKFAGIGNVELALYLFTGCFDGCSGILSTSAPGPRCGWKFSSTFSVGNSSATLVDGEATLTSVGASAIPGIYQDLRTPLLSVDTVSGSFEFTEFPPAGGDDPVYELIVHNHDLSEVVQVILGETGGDGYAVVQFGSPDATEFWVAFDAWAINTGDHNVYFSVNNGNPILFIDDVEISLSLFGTPAVFDSSPANTVAYYAGSGGAGSTNSTVRNIFVTAEDVGSETTLSCF